ncbi:MAG: hypothetical protein BWY57_02452 [Betaproteobacteria bacterium ADurb.Bin341]|nr:MAG: hypothetical protein BWY57_02452 [Betaproteobacteria bacterium ADurb.Bin341]
MLKEFTDSAKSLTKNPLGIIGLFIVLVYGFACLVLAKSGEYLNPNERQPLVWFLVLFPICILVAFYRLVTKHHKKLYAPSDYRDEKLFVTPQTDEQRSNRLEQEVKRIESLDDVSKELEETSRIVSNIRASYADAERMAFLAIEQEIGHPFNKYVEVKSHNQVEQFDGVLVTDKQAHLIEVKYFNRPAFKREFLEAVIHRASGFIWNKTMDAKTERDSIVLWLAIVVGFEREAMPTFQKKVESSVSCELFDVRLRFYHIDDLKKKYC